MSKFCCFQRHSTKEDKIILKPKLQLELETEVELKIAHGLKLRLELKFKLELEKSLKIIYCSVPHSTENPVFSVNFSSAVKGSFIAGKAKDRGAFFRGQGGSGVRDMAPPLLGNLGAKFSETSFPHFKTSFTQIGRCYLYTTILNHWFQSFYLVLDVLFPKCVAHKKKSCVYFSTDFSIYSFIFLWHVRIGSDRITTWVFF